MLSASKACPAACATLAACRVDLCARTNASWMPTSSCFGRRTHSFPPSAHDEEAEGIVAVNTSEEAGALATLGAALLKAGASP